MSFTCSLNLMYLIRGKNILTIYSIKKEKQHFRYTSKQDLSHWLVLLVVKRHILTEVSVNVRSAFFLIYDNEQNM